MVLGVLLGQDPGPDPVNELLSLSKCLRLHVVDPLLGHFPEDTAAAPSRDEIGQQLPVALLLAVRNMHTELAMQGVQQARGSTANHLVYQVPASKA